MTQEISILNSFTKEQVDLLKQQIAPGCNDLQLKYFLSVAKRSGLDPISNQIYCIMRKVKNKDTGLYDNKMSIQTGIDGFRAIAERSGVYAGQTPVEFLFAKDKDGKDDYSSPISATVGVKKVINGQIVTTYATAWFDEYAQKTYGGDLMGLWKTGKKIMLAKCAEALALRKAFPNELSGIYTEEEGDVIDSGDDIMKVELKPFQKREFLEFITALREGGEVGGKSWVEDYKHTLEYPDYIREKITEAFNVYKKNMGISDEQVEDIWKPKEFKG